jgi:hypothetical protein
VWFHESLRVLLNVEKVKKKRRRLVKRIDFKKKLKNLLFDNWLRHYIGGFQQGLAKTGPYAYQPLLSHKF